MKRREFITLAGAAALVWPLTARAQQAERRRLIGLVTGFSKTELTPLVGVFSTRLRELGWIEGQTFTIDARATAGDYRQLVADAGALVEASADVIVAVGTPGLKAVQEHTRSVPIVFLLVADPVGQGIIDSLARPGGNVTGLTNFEFSIGSKWLELLKDVDRSISRVTLLTNPENANTAPFVGVISTAAKSMGIETTTASVRNASEIEHAITSAGQTPGGSLIVFPDSLPIVHRALIVGLVARLRLPAIYPFRVFPTNDGLMSYGLDIAEVYRQAAVYTDKILRGAKPADLPVQAPNKFELVINLNTAKALGLTVPATLLARADEVIE